MYDSIPADSRFWDNKTISLTEKTKKTILKKAYMLDAEALFAKYNLEGEEAVDAAEQNNITQEQLLSNTSSYTYLAASAINDLEANRSTSSRVEAVKNLLSLGFTNIYEDNTKNFITPAEKKEKESDAKSSSLQDETQASSSISEIDGDAAVQYNYRVSPPPIAAPAPHSNTKKQSTTSHTSSAPPSNKPLTPPKDAQTNISSRPPSFSRNLVKPSYSLPKPPHQFYTHQTNTTVKTGPQQPQGVRYPSISPAVLRFASQKSTITPKTSAKVNHIALSSFKPNKPSAPSKGSAFLSSLLAKKNK